ncbi:MAG: N-acetylmuramoyl-L-alanine amidase [Verrucomicrobia bacterium]|jgi:N-acetyl-anhydromuramyl-L-alanine amidase AmpD|nr:N-acetylmuramoyl-L-alanine amidase [Verrucomicrobiota bacterium]
MNCESPNATFLIPISCRALFFAGAVLATAFVTGCRTTPTPRPGDPLARCGDEIVVAGRFFHCGTPVVLWMDPGGYDAYRVERRFAPLDEADWSSPTPERKYPETPNRYGMRREGLTEDELERFRGGGWDLESLQEKVDQFVLHYDVAGTSERCFKILHDGRGLSVHFLLDLDGTIYQTLDLKERAWHATSSNDRSIGIEIANMGAYRIGGQNPFAEWYRVDTNGQTRITVPERYGDGGIRTPDFIGRPARNEPVRGVIQGMELEQYEFTLEQYAALTRLTAALCRVFPGIQCRYPTDANGRLIPHKLPDEELRHYQGVLGHYHIQADKVDPGPAMDWDRVIDGARALMTRSSALRAGRGW